MSNSQHPQDAGEGYLDRPKSNLPATVPSATLEIDRARETATRALANRPGFDLATLTEEEFEDGLARIRRRQARMQRIHAEVLVPDVHFGDAKGKFKTRRLFKAGAEELMSLWRLAPRLAAAPDIQAGPDLVSVTVRIGLYDSRGHFLLERSANCNSFERRFKRADKKIGGWTYDDPREVLHDCIAMAEKRAIVSAVLAATGADGMFSNGEAMAQAIEVREQDAAAGEAKAAEIPPATREQLAPLYKLAHKCGLTDRDAFAAFVVETLGVSFVGADDIPVLTAALEARKAREAAKTTEAPAPAGPVEDAQWEPAAPEPGDAAE